MLPIDLVASAHDRLLNAQRKSRLQGGALIPKPRPGWPSSKLPHSPKPADLTLFIGERCNRRDPFLGLCTVPFHSPPKPCSLSFSIHKPHAMLSGLQSLFFILIL